MRVLHHRLLPFVIAGLSAQAAAQQAGDAGPITQVEVEGTAASYDPRRDDTATRIVVRREEIARFGDTSLAEVFKRIAGVSVSSGAGRSVEVRMREAKLGYLASSDFRGPTFNLDLGESGERDSHALTVSGNHDSLSREASSLQQNTRPDGVVDLRRSVRLPEDRRMNRLNLGPRVNWTLDDGDTLAWESLATSSSFRNQATP